jgi:hypothetical protein
MATTAQNARLNPYLFDDALVPVSASGFGTAHQGDWIGASAQWGIAMTPAIIGSPAFKVSALGVAMENNPTFDHLGRALNNSGFIVLTRGVLRVSGGNSGTARTIPIGAHAYPATTGSGIIGTTGATGVGVVWMTAPPQGISANPTGAIPSGVAQVINHPVGGDATASQIDIRFNLATNVGYF